MMRLTNIIVLLAFMLPAALVLGQDNHFSQFYAAPLTMNPALSGAFDGSFRVGGIYRDQWRGALDRPFSTFSASVDLRFPMNQRRTAQDAVGAGIVFFTDRVQGVDFSTNQMAFTGAYHKALDRDNSQYLSAGLKLGFTQRNVNYDQLTFEDQFDGTGGYGLPSGEELSDNNFSYADLGFGLYYVASPNRFTSYYAGLAVHHFNRPNISFFQDLEDVPTDELYMKTVGHFGARLPLSPRLQIFPRLVASLQGPHIETTLGANLRVAVDDYSSYALHFGLWGRPVRSDESMAMDAIITMVGLEYQNILFGLSYDANMNSLSNYGEAHGAFEISVMYMGDYENETVLCPAF